MEFMPHPLVIASIAVALWGIYLILVRPKVHDKRLDLVARELGLEYFPEGDPTIRNELWHLRLFNQGHSRNLSNMMSGHTRKVDVAIFSYEYSTGGAEDEQVRRHSVICIHSNKLSLPVFEIHAKGVHRGSALGYYDIELDLHSGFSRRFLLRAPEEEPVLEFMTKKMLKGIAGLSGCCIEGNRDWLIYYKVGHRLTSRDVHDLMKEGLRVFHLLKGEPQTNKK